MSMATMDAIDRLKVDPRLLAANHDRGIKIPHTF